MKKLLKIALCFDCPHYHHIYDKKAKRRHSYICAKKNLLIGKYPYNGHIPDWCPLPSAFLSDAPEYEVA